MTPQDEFQQLQREWAARREAWNQERAAHELERRKQARDCFRNGDYIKTHFAQCAQCGVAILTLKHEDACDVGKAARPQIIGR